MSKRRSVWTPITIFILITSLIGPQLTAADSHLSELKEKEQQLDLRVRLLQDDVQQEEDALGVVTNRVGQLQSSIAEIQQQLRENEERITTLNQVIAERTVAIDEVKVGLAAAVRDLADSERTSLLALLFNHDSFSDALREIDEKQLLTEKIGQQYRTIIEHTENLSAARDQLELAKLSLASSRVSLDLQHQALRAEQEQQRALLAQSKSLLQAAEVERIEIRQQLFAAAFDNTGQAITFEQAIFYAQLAAQRLREYNGQEISVPLLLAVVRHESNFGNYLGKGHYRSAMCSQAQINAFLKITSELGLDPELTPVSKPARNQSCGGAMGYAQFLPTTWLGYVNRVAQLTGHNPPSPWHAEDAFMAVALKLAANGATRGSTLAEKRQAQWEAVMTYFSGSRWRNPAILRNIHWYGDNILRTADSYAALI